MDDIFADLEKKADEEPKNPEQLGILSRLVKRQRQLEESADEERASQIYRETTEDSLKTLEMAVRKKKDELNQIAMKEIPEILNMVQLREFTTDDGLKLTLHDGVQVSVKDKEKFHGYLRKNGLSDLIKDEIILKQFNRGEVLKYLKKRNYDFEEKAGVHAQTLKKFVKDRLANGEEMPQGIDYYEYKQARIKETK